ncbi:hypothetical protein [Arthrobacter psychrolactophilus]|uniref:hypothetical protein n=1 Tax=Arthrobacter psychrolactophilus TaxID=92442 RepID=UPI0026B24830|nr:hypothetical protein [Arthrobacter psychrolactophilus]
MGILAASLLAYYSFVGFETSANVAEEVRDVHCVYPKALFGALLKAGGIYALIGLRSPHRTGLGRHQHWGSAGVAHGRPGRDELSVFHPAEGNQKRDLLAAGFIGHQILPPSSVPVSSE